MKKIKALIVFLIATIFPMCVNAASGNVTVSSASTAIVGSQIKVTVTLSSSTSIGSWNLSLNYNKNYLSLISSTAEAGGTIMSNSSAGTKSKSYTYIFKALKSGTTQVSISSYEAYAYNDMSELKLNILNKSIRIMTQEELEATYSKDNDLKKLEVEGYSLTPTFAKDVLEYTLSVPNTVTKINIIAEKNDSKASLSGAGEKDVLEGSNKFEILVTAENGSEKKYLLTINVEDLNPIIIKINGKNMSVIKRKDILTKPDLFEEKMIKINDFDIPAFYSDISKITLVGVKDDEGNASLAIYNEKTNEYKLYSEFKSNNISLYIEEPKEIPGYTKTAITINNVKVNAYKYKEDSRFVIIYGMNLETGEYNYYSYDTKEKTFQIWNQEEVLDLKNDVKTYTYACIAFGGGLLFAFILIICLLHKRKKKNKKIKVDDKKNVKEKNENPEENKKIEEKSNKEKVSEKENIDELFDKIKNEQDK